MKHKIFFLLMLCGAMGNPLYAASQESFQLIIENIELKRGGQLIVLVFGPDGFPIEHDKALSAHVVEISGTTMSVVVPVPENNFAIKVLHDEDLNGRVTKNWTGLIPKEGLGFSNKQKIRFGPPEFEPAKINRSQQPHKITLRY